MQVNPYLNFNGQCEEAFNFYQEILGGKIVAMLPHAGSPAAEHVPADWQSKIMHARLDLGATMLLGSDSPPGYFEHPKGIYVSLFIDSPEEADRVFGALSDNAAIRMPIQETFWALRFGMLVDRFGIPWMINCSKPQ